MALPQVPESTLLRIATLLASGLKSNQVSSIIGLSPARISQISAEESFQSLLQEKLADASKKDVEETAITAKYLSAEHLLIDQMVQMAPSAELRDVTAALRVITERQDKASLRRNPIHAGVTVHQHVVQLNLPTHALPEIIISKENEVTAINETNLAPLTADGVQNLFKRMKSTELLGPSEARGSSLESDQPQINRIKSVSLERSQNLVNKPYIENEVEAEGPTRTLETLVKESPAQGQGQGQGLNNILSLGERNDQRRTLEGTSSLISQTSPEVATQQLSLAF